MEYRGGHRYAKIFLRTIGTDFFHHHHHHHHHTHTIPSVLEALQSSLHAVSLSEIRFHQISDRVSWGFVVDRFIRFRGEFLIKNSDFSRFLPEICRKIRGERRRFDGRALPLRRLRRPRTPGARCLGAGGHADARDAVRPLTSPDVTAFLPTARMVKVM